MKEVNLRQGYQVGEVITNGWKGLCLVSRSDERNRYRTSPKERKCFSVILCMLFWSSHLVAHDFSYSHLGWQFSYLWSKTLCRTCISTPNWTLNFAVFLSFKSSCWWPNLFLCPLTQLLIYDISILKILSCFILPSNSLCSVPSCSSCHHPHYAWISP